MKFKRVKKTKSFEMYWKFKYDDPKIFICNRTMHRINLTEMKKEESFHLMMGDHSKELLIDFLDSGEFVHLGNQKALEIKEIKENYAI